MMPAAATLAGASDRSARVPEPGPTVTVHGLHKSFGRVAVLRSVDASFAAGRITALIGPNAAGKSTLFKCLLGLARADSGSMRVGSDLAGGDHRCRRLIGYMPQAARFPDQSTGREVRTLLRDLRQADDPTDDDLFQQFGLGSELDKPVATLSGGTRQKLNAALAFVFRPRLLVLDEPTAGLDPLAAGILKRKLTATRDQGTTVIVASHVLAELEEMADDVVLLLEGVVRYQGSLSQLRQETGETRLERAVACLMTLPPAPR